MNVRLRVTFLIILFSFFLIVARLFYWQVVKASELSSLGQQQYGGLITITSQRGDIRSSDGFPLATSKVSYLVFANPKEILDKKSVLDSIVSILNVDSASVSGELSLDKYWVPLASGVDLKTKTKLQSLNLTGIGFEQEYSRFYPEASMAAQLLGFVGKDDQGKDKGYFGLEGYYDLLLKGKEGSVVQLHDATGKPILAKINEDSNAMDGSNLILTINRAIQFLIESKLKDGIEQYGASSGMAAVMDPKTGGILAMASFPSFDQRDYQDFSQDLYKNPLITNLYEPGSTFKPIVMSSAFNAKVVTPETKCNICSGPIQVGDYALHTWNDKYFPNTNMVEVILHSDNTGMVFVAQKLGTDKMLNYLDKFGIGDLTGIDLQGEVNPSLKPNNQWYPVDLATAGFGQGISVTPIELLDAISAIANNGERMEPHVVSAIESPDGTLTTIQPKVLDKPISEETAKVMTEILVNAVNKGEASWARLKGYRIAGKTGTASIPVAGHYDPNQTIASFIGFAPADNPKFVMLVILNRPTVSIYGAETAAPIFFSIAKDLLSYYGVSPQGEE